MTLLRDLDDRAFWAVNDFAVHTPWLQQAMVAFAKYGVVLFGLLLLAGVLAARHGSAHTLAGASWAPLAVLLAVALNQPLGHLVHESRAYVAHPDAFRLAGITADFSFPSDHAVMAGSTAAALWLISRRLGSVAAVLALLMAFARVYIAAHYPWDVVGGLTFGALVALLGWLVVRVPMTAVTARMRDLPGLRRIAGCHVPSPGEVQDAR